LGMLRLTMEDEAKKRFRRCHMADGESKTTDRLEAFSDAIFAFSMTLLMFGIKVPDVPDNATRGDITMWVIGLLPTFLIYIFTFVIIGIYWVAHHRTFEHIIRHDSNLLWLNLAFLLTISLLPFPTAILGEYGDNSEAVALYAFFMGLSGALLMLIWIYATADRRLVSKNMPEREIRGIRTRGLATSLIFLLSAPLAIFHPTIAMLSWLSIPFVALHLK